MAGYRKLNKPSDQRKAMLRSIVTGLLWHGKVETTLARAKEARSIAEKLITLAAREYDSTVTVKKVIAEDGDKFNREVVNDAPSKLAARRKMMSYLYDVQELKEEGESKFNYRARTKESKHPLVEKMFREIGPKYRERAKDLGTGGGYTRIIKKGPRRGDATEMAILELV
ncbi:MAG: 50S ribosomal protein L17 [Clostridia bacterium]|jgi:large subunit ribosomal protein L17|nr:50S ribosomal protein L17 [Clostridia bacterium]MBT7122361.1 50S ribosomal protein L17 [Clostridia bacterium]